MDHARLDGLRRVDTGRVLLAPPRFVRAAAAFVGSPTFLLSATACRASRDTTAGLIVTPSRMSNVAISYLPPGLSRGSISRSRRPRQKPSRTRSSSARINSAGPFAA
jgi:hypothetical protein